MKFVIGVLDFELFLPVLYHKYRPQKFEEVFGQEPIIRTLRNSLEQDRVGQAYLFAGPRGVGKTSVARILAHQLGVSELDLIEIDAASNRGIDDVRALRDQVNFLPARGTKKLYILDEAHMLTSEAFNALLKTLEEPPGHVHFVLCTTEPYKLPITIVSRCQRFDFNLADEQTLTEYLQFMAKQEKIGIEKEAVELLAGSAQGSFRDALVLLEKAALAIGKKEKKEISAEMAREALGLASEVQVMKFAELISQKKSPEALELIEKLNEGGVEMKSFVEAVIRELRRKLLADSTKADGNSDELIELIDLIVNLIGVTGEIKNAPVASLPLEMMVIEWGRQGDSGGRFAHDFADASAPPGFRPEPYVVQGSMLNRSQKPPLRRSKTDAGKRPPSSTSNGSVRENRDLNPGLQKAWSQILEQIKPHNHSVEALLRGCQPVSLKEDILTLRFLYQFHRERIAESPNRQLVEEVAGGVLGQKVRIKCVMGRSNSGKGPRKAFGDVFSKNAVDDVEKIPKDDSRVAVLARRAPEDGGGLRAEGSAAAQSFRGKVSSGFAGEAAVAHVSDQVSNSDKDLLKLAHEVLGGEIIE